jgi:DNA invertase Pin-like site-specific DNA recombinase
MITALAYLRTSSASNVGADKDSDKRQRAAIEAYAAAHGIEIVGEYYDAAVSGVDPVETRPGFAAMLDRIDGNCVRLVIVEDASRFARSMLAQELGVALMVKRGVRVVTASGDDLTETDDEMRVAMRQVFGAFSQMEKTRLVKKLRVARDRKSEVAGKRVEGRKADEDLHAAVVALKATEPDLSLRAIAARLADQGFTTKTGKALAVSHVAHILKTA